MRRWPNGRRVYCLIDTGEVLSPHLAQHARLEIDAAGLFRELDAEPAVPNAGAGHQANHVSGPAMFRSIGLRSVDKKGIEGIAGELTVIHKGLGKIEGRLTEPELQKFLQG